MTARRTFIIGGEPRVHKSVVESMRGYFAALNKSKRWRVMIEPYVRKRSTNQNSLYWQWCTLIADETGNDKDDVHEFLLGKFCPVKSVTLVGEDVERASSRLLNTAEMTQYMDRVQAWAATMLNMTLPLPQDEGMLR